MDKLHKHSFAIIYLLGSLFALNVAIPTYINSTFISSFAPEKAVGIFYAIAAILTLIALVWGPHILHKYGNYRTILTSIIINLISILVLAFSNSFILVSLAFIINLVLTATILFNLDVFLEHFSEDQHTGEIRGTYLSARNMAWVTSPIIAGFVLADGDYWKIYLLSAMLLLPIIYLLTKNFRKYEDSRYERVPFWETLKIIKKRRNVYKIFMSNLLLRFFFSWMVIYTPIYLHQHIGFTWSTIGTIFSIMLLPFVLFELPLGRLADNKLGEKEMLNIGFVIIGISTAVLTFVTSTSPIVWAVLLFTTRIGASMVEIMTESYFFKRIDGEDTNIIGFFRMSRPLAYIAGPLLASILLMFMDINHLFIVLGGIVLVGGLYHGLTIKDTK